MKSLRPYIFAILGLLIVWGIRPKVVYVDRVVKDTAESESLRHELATLQRHNDVYLLRLRQMSELVESQIVPEKQEADDEL